MLPPFRIYFFFCQKHTPKSRKFNIWPDFTYGTDSCVVPWRAIYDDIDSIDLNTVQLNTKQMNVPLKIQAGHLGKVQCNGQAGAAG